MIVLLAAFLLSILSLSHSARLDSEILNGIVTGDMEFIWLSHPPTIVYLKEGNTVQKRTDGRIRMLGKRKILLSK